LNEGGERKESDRSKGVKKKKKMIHGGRDMEGVNGVLGAQKGWENGRIKERSRGG